jgi:arylsulfatase
MSDERTQHRSHLPMPNRERSPDHGPQGDAFNGTVKGVQLAIADAAESVDRLVDPGDAIRVALARQ